MSKTVIYRITGRVAYENGWVKQNPAISGEILVNEDQDGNGLFIGYINDSCFFNKEAKRQTETRYLIGTLGTTENGTDGIRIYAMSNDADQRTIFYNVFDLNIYGTWHSLNYRTRTGNVYGERSGLASIRIVEETQYKTKEEKQKAENEIKRIFGELKPNLRFNANTLNDFKLSLNEAFGIIFQQAGSPG